MAVGGNIGGRPTGYGTYAPLEWEWVIGKGISCDAKACRLKAIRRGKWLEQEGYLNLCGDHWNERLTRRISLKAKQVGVILLSEQYRLVGIIKLRLRR